MAGGLGRTGGKRQWAEGRQRRTRQGDMPGAGQSQSRALQRKKKRGTHVGLDNSAEGSGSHFERIDDGCWGSGRDGRVVVFPAWPRSRPSSPAQHGAPALGSTRAGGERPRSCRPCPPHTLQQTEGPGDQSRTSPFSVHRLALSHLHWNRGTRAVGWWVEGEEDGRSGSSCSWTDEWQRDAVQPSHSRSLCFFLARDPPCQTDPPHYLFALTSSPPSSGRGRRLTPGPAKRSTSGRHHLGRSTVPCLLRLVACAREESTFARRPANSIFSDCSHQHLGLTVHVGRVAADQHKG